MFAAVVVVCVVVYVVAVVVDVSDFVVALTFYVAVILFCYRACHHHRSPLPSRMVLLLLLVSSLFLLLWLWLLLWQVFLGDGYFYSLLHQDLLAQCVVGVPTCHMCIRTNTHDAQSSSMPCSDYFISVSVFQQVAVASFMLSASLGA